MANWTWFEWLIVQALLITLFGCLGLGAAFQMYRLRVQRLQDNYKKLALSIGDVISKTSDEGGVRFDALLMQTQAYLQSEGISVPWQDDDPWQYPHLIAILLRSAVLELEYEVYGDINESDYWLKLSENYEKILLQFSRDGQALSVGAGALKTRALSATEDDELFSMDQSSDELYAKILAERASGEIDERASDYQVNILSNIIDDQKERILSLRKDLQQSQSKGEPSDSAPNGLELETKETSILELQAQNEQLSSQLLMLEKTAASKDQELTQLLEQMDAAMSAPPALLPVQEPGGDIAVRQALVEAWMASEASLAKLEQQVLAGRQT